MMTIGLIGVGLIGGSMALKLKNKNFADKILAFDKSEVHLYTAKELNIIDEIASFENLVRDSDLIIIALPVEATKVVLPEVLDRISDKTVVMDVGSTKQEITNIVEQHPNRKNFVASHPMWGTENSGPMAATSEAFTDRAAVICNHKDSYDVAVEMVKQVYENLDMNILYMDADKHDIHTAYISHISHITSYALANTVLEKEREEDTIFQLASSGFSSTVRLAKSHPEMWVSIFKQNKENVLDVLNEHISQLKKFKSALEKENFDFLEELIVNANRIRGILDK
ncbi:prephenate dehydrogenase [Chryseobacterium sp. TY3]